MISRDKYLIELMLIGERKNFTIVGSFNKSLAIVVFSIRMFTSQWQWQTIQPKWKKKKKLFMYTERLGD